VNASSAPKSWYILPLIFSFLVASKPAQG
jgi:hypothetical protein